MAKTLVALYDTFPDAEGVVHELVAYPALADNVPGPLPSRLRCLTQPIMSPPNRFSTPRLSRLACI
jgi:hypothetical protein